MAAAEWGRKMKKPYLGRPFPLEQHIIIINILYCKAT